MKEAVNVRMLKDGNSDLNKQDIERVDKDILYSIHCSNYQVGKCWHEVMLS